MLGKDSHLWICSVNITLKPNDLRATPSAKGWWPDNRGGRGLIIVKYQGSTFFQIPNVRLSQGFWS